MVKVWYHVVIDPRVLGETGEPKVFGFALDETKTIIVDHAEYQWKGCHITDYKPYLLSVKAQVQEVKC